MKICITSVSQVYLKLNIELRSPSVSYFDQSDLL